LPSIRSINILPTIAVVRRICGSMSYVLPNIANFWNPASTTPPLGLSILIMSWKYNNQSKEADSGEKRPIVEKSVHGCVGLLRRKRLQTHLPIRSLLLATLAAIGVVLNLTEPTIQFWPVRLFPRREAAQARSSNAASPKEPGGVAPEPGRSNEAGRGGDPSRLRRPQQNSGTRSGPCRPTHEQFHIVGETAADRPLSANEDWSRALRHEPLA